MAELTPISTAQRPSDAYQPVSGYTVAATLVTGVFVVVLLAVLGFALFSKRQILGYELLALPAVGIGLAAAARAHIRQSEGTRSGLKIAAAAWWVSVLGGAGFGAYVYANQYFLERESAAFVQKFFDEIKADRLRHAFQSYAIHPSERDRASPDNPEQFDAQYGPSGFGMFKNHEFVRLIRQSGGDAEFEHIGVKDLAQDSGGFLITHIYKMKCPEGLFEVRIGVQAAETKRGGKPQWQIAQKPQIAMSVKPEHLSEYGQLVRDLDGEGQAFYRGWLTRVNSNATVMAHLLTTPLAHRRPLEESLAAQTALVGGPATRLRLWTGALPADRRGPRDREMAAHGALIGGSVVPFMQATLAFDDLADIGFFRRDDVNSPYPADRWAEMRTLWTNNLKLASTNLDRAMPTNQVAPDAKALKLKPDLVTLVVPTEWYLNSSINFAKCHIGIECTTPEVLKALAEARARGGAAADDQTTSPISRLPTRDWRIAWLRTDLEPNSMATGPPEAAGR